MNKLNILIADDHPMMREALRTAIENEDDFNVIGEAINGIDAVKMAIALKPDVILMDMLMPGLNGLEAIAQILEKYPQAKIMVVTSLEDEEKILAAVQAGALGYFPKTAPRAYLIDGLRRVADGVPYLPVGIAMKLFKGIRDMKQPTFSSNEVTEPLTARQEELLALIAEGRSDHEISEMLHLSEATVRAHVHQIRLRLGLENRSQLIAFANRERKSRK